MGVAYSVVRVSISEIAHRDFYLTVPVPRSLPASKIKYAIQQVRGQSPNEMAVHLESRPGIARRMPDPGTVRRVGKQGDGHDIDRGGLRRIQHCDRAGFPPPGDHRRDVEPTHFHMRRRQYAEDIDPAPVDAS